ncbi:MAG: lipoprotein [Gammaproteobacteria bacterium]|nr:lipoprotein [Gammaproteobacteria bacterium]
MHRKEQKRRTTGRWAVIGMLCLLLLAACGQKGDLYLPDGEQSGSRQTG